MQRWYRSFTFWFTLPAILLCLFHFVGFDHDSIVFKMFSAPMWVLPIFVNIYELDITLLYGLTILTWLIAGMLLDHMVYRAKRAR